MFTPSVSSFDQSTIDWVNAVIADGGAVSDTQKTNVNTLIVALKAHGLFTILDRLWLYGGESDAHQAKIDIINLGTHSVSGGVTLSAGGYTSNGTTGFLNTNFNPTTAGGNFTQNSASIGVYAQESQASGALRIPIGAFDGSVFVEYAASSGDGSIFINNASILNKVSDVVAAFWVGSRTTSTLITGYKNGASWGTDVNATIGLLNSDIFVLARNNSGADSFTISKYAASFIGGALTGAQAADFSTDLNGYMTSWGINVY